MKTRVKISIIASLALITVTGFAQQNPNEYLGLPGDNLNLYAVLNLFQESETLEAFERNLNDQESTINNLDLNGDNLIDYITVSDYVDKDVHNIVLRAALNSNEQQDIAVFVVEKLRNGEVQIQLIGDEALYGRNYIVEPIYAETPNPGYKGNNRDNVGVVSTSYYQVSAWPVIRYVYRPGYVVWRSSWYWGYYPTYWNPWTPHYWHYYYGYHSHWNNHYYSRYRHWDHYRSNSYTSYYFNRVRVYSPTVVVNINNGRYNSSYSRPDQRRAGEDYYTRTASSRSGTNQNNVTNQRSNSRGSNPAVQPGRTNSNSRSTVTRSSTSRTTQPSATRSSSNTSKPAVTRSSSSKPDATRSSTTRSTQQSTTRSSSNTSKPAVTRSSSSKPAATRSNTTRSTQPSATRSSSNTSKPAVTRSSSSKSSKPAVTRSSSSKSSKPAVTRSSSNKASSAQRSQSSSSKSSASRTSKSKSSSKK